MSESVAAAAPPAVEPLPDSPAHTDADLFAEMALAGASVARAHAAFAEFHRRHAAYLYAVCLKRYRDAAEEIVAETLRRVYESASRFDPTALVRAANTDAARQLVRAWVGQIVRWVAADHFAECARRGRTVALEADASALEPRADDCDAALVAGVRGAIEELPPREQEIAWTVAHGWSPEHGRLRWSAEDLDALAARFGLTRDNLRQVRARLIRKLRDRLAPLLNARPAEG